MRVVDVVVVLLILLLIVILLLRVLVLVLFLVLGVVAVAVVVAVVLVESPTDNGIRDREHSSCKTGGSRTWHHAAQAEFGRRRQRQDADTPGAAGTAEPQDSQEEPGERAPPPPGCE